MKKQTRRKFSAEFKAKVALEAVKNQQTISELANRFDVSPVVISKWKAEFLENVASVFEKGGRKSDDQDNPEIEKLYAQIGQLKVENDFLKKFAGNWGYEGTFRTNHTQNKEAIGAQAVPNTLGQQKHLVLQAS